MRRAGRGLVVLLEVLLLQQYVVRGTAWHGLLHSLVGIGVGLSAGALVSAARGRATSGFAWGVGGQTVSVAPDVLFAAVGLVHRHWMDLFVGHIAIHTAPAPLLVAVVVFLLGGWAWWLAAAAVRRTVGSLVAVVALAVLAVALAQHRPIPTRLVEFTATSASRPAYACRVGSGSATALPTTQGYVFADGRRPARH